MTASRWGTKAEPPSSSIHWFKRSGSHWFSACGLVTADKLSAGRKVLPSEGVAISVEDMHRNIAARGLGCGLCSKKVAKWCAR